MKADDDPDTELRAPGSVTSSSLCPLSDPTKPASTIRSIVYMRAWTSKHEFSYALDPIAICCANTINLFTKMLFIEAPNLYTQTHLWCRVTKPLTVLICFIFAGPDLDRFTGSM